MNSPEAAELLHAWELGLGKPLLQRALILLAAALPGSDPQALARLSIGQRDQRLLSLREQLFGGQMLNISVCPNCEEPVEWENHTGEFLSPPAAKASAVANEFEVTSDGYALRFRSPNSLDLADKAEAEDLEWAQRDLLANCLIEAKKSGVECDFDSLPGTVQERLLDEIEARDSLADIRIELSCPECSHRWVALFDIADFLWKEVNGWAVQMLQTIARLAALTGWNEREILRLSPVRRQLYLGMLE